MNIKRVIIIAVFTALWSALEIVIGPFLHHLPASPLPSGAIMSIFIIPILSIVYCIDNKYGIITFIGFLTAIFKLASLSGVKFPPSIGIFFNACIFDIFIRILPLENLKFRIFIAGICSAIAGSITGRLIGGFLIKAYTNKTLPFILAYLGIPAFNALIGGILGAIIAIITVDRLKKNLEVYKMLNDKN
ncbi:MAG TPA: hypothetical protein PLM75_03730 [bacterium]|mgnify:CR=1 FL=1|nr:hypothetical protein [bacterium]HPP86957.1 hypothetical protein [bacterium]